MHKASPDVKLVSMSYTKVLKRKRVRLEVSEKVYLFRERKNGKHWITIAPGTKHEEHLRGSIKSL